MNSAAVGVLCLSLSLVGCAGREMVRPPEVVKVRELVPLPTWCLVLEPVTLPPGSTSDDVEREQHRALLAYEARVTACRQLNIPHQPANPSP